MHFSHFTKIFVIGVVVGTIICASFGASFFVQAIAPGATTTPIFGPTDDDVVLNPRLDCVKTPGAGTPICPAGYTRTGCGGHANDDNNHVHGASPNTCNTDGGPSFAICCKVIF